MKTRTHSKEILKLIQSEILLRLKDESYSVTKILEELEKYIIKFISNEKVSKIEYLNYKIFKEEDYYRILYLKSYALGDAKSGKFQYDLGVDYDVDLLSMLNATERVILLNIDGSGLYVMDNIYKFVGGYGTYKDVEVQSFTIVNGEFQRTKQFFEGREKVREEDSIIRGLKIK